MWQTITAGNPWHGRLTGRTKSGAPITFEISMAPLRDERGVVHSYVGMVQDITRELNQEAQAGEALRLESIGRLAGGVAHDFNNMLAAILLNAEQLLLAAPEQEVQELAVEIRDAALRARDVTKQLLAFARRQVFSPAPVDLTEVLAASEKTIRRLLAENITLELRSASGLSLALCDRAQLEQVLIKLALNARDSMPSGGRLTLTTSMLRPGDGGFAQYPGLEPGEYVELAVQDTGVGIPPENVGHIFEPFFTTKGVGKGTGLGLATVYGILKQSKGAIRCESAPGAGTTFLLCLPGSPGPSPAEPSALEQRSGVAARAEKETLLLVDDEPLVRRTVSRALVAGGYRVLEAQSGAEALALAARHSGQIDLLVTDVMMPGMSGGELAARLAVLKPGLRALFISGHPGEALTNGSQLLQGVELLQKPFNTTDLQARIRGLLDA
jgi:signal transduction histidine kinase/CheY-like chemotaxis protein